MFYCSKIGERCPYPIEKDSNYIFVIMPFADSISVYDAIKQAVNQVSNLNITVERADEKFTRLSIWCNRICTNIRKAKYCIVDTTGSNPNVFYELGFAHAISGTKTIIITQKIEEAPFDIRELGHIIYSEKNLPKLRDDIIKAIEDMELENLVDRNLSYMVYSEKLNITINIDPDTLDELVNRTLEKLRMSKI